jgi:hypothetical protein
MNYYGAKELADSLRTVRKNTLIIAEEIPEEHYGFRPAPDTRTVAQITHSHRGCAEDAGTDPLHREARHT